MAVFKYKAFNQEKKIVQGLIDSLNEKVAAETLRERGYSIISIEAKNGFSLDSFIGGLNRVAAKDLVVFSRQFSVMISANVSLVQALRIIVNQTENPKLKLVVAEIANEVDSGSRLSDALAKRPKIFSNFYISVIRSGETSGKLDEVLTYLADEMEKDYDMMSKVKSAMIYPVVLFTILICIGIFMMIFVVPKLVNIITESGGSLPLPTRVLIGISNFFVNFWWVLLLILVVLSVSAIFYKRTEIGTKNIDYLKLKLPVFGKLFRTIYVVRFTRSMKTLISGGVTISKSLTVSSEVVGNTIYKDLILKTLKEVEDGSSISSVFFASDEMPKMVSQMMSVGEKTGKIDLVLEKITDFYTREINNTINNLMTLIEPIIILIMGVAVAGIVLAIIMPMYNMVGQF